MKVSRCCVAMSPPSFTAIQKVCLQTDFWLLPWIQMHVRLYRPKIVLGTTLQASNTSLLINPPRNPEYWYSTLKSGSMWMRLSELYFLHVHREYFMESAGVRYLRTSCWRIRNRTSERSERGRFLIQKQRVRKYRTKHFPCGIVFIIYILRHSSFWRPFYFKSFKNAKICRYTLTAKWQRKRSISFLVKTFVKNIKDGKDTR